MISLSHFTYFRSFHQDALPSKVTFLNPLCRSMQNHRISRCIHLGLIHAFVHQVIHKKNHLILVLYFYTRVNLWWFLDVFVVIFQWRFYELCCCPSLGFVSENFGVVHNQLVCPWIDMNSGMNHKFAELILQINN